MAAALSGEEPVSSHVEFLSATLTPLAPAAVISALCSEATNIALYMDWVILLCLFIRNSLFIFPFLQHPGRNGASRQRKCITMMSKKKSPVQYLAHSRYSVDERNYR